MYLKLIYLVTKETTVSMKDMLENYDVMCEENRRLR